MPFLIAIGKILAWKVLLSKLLWNANNAAVMTIALPVFTLTVLAPGAHSQFGSGKNTQFEPEQRANPFENVFSKTAVFPPPAIAETDL